MQIIPAIDLRGGRCVRLQQGDFERETVFGDDPVAMAGFWVAQGARWLHLVDLDGAKTGVPSHVDVISDIVKLTGIPCQVGGGLRDDAAVEAYLTRGVKRAIVGTAALRDPEWFGRLVERWPGRVVLGLDARGGRVATQGWLSTSSVSALELATRFDNLPLAAVIYTDIGRDGMLEGADVDGTGALARAIRTPVIASGGVGSIDDIKRLSALGLAGCIAGRALYDRRFSLAEAQAVADAAARGQT
jgi:phosphoribosylformimino-5-aminoimidazole carboxamide ribotide isomerase